MSTITVTGGAWKERIPTHDCGIVKAISDALRHALHALHHPHGEHIDFNIVKFQRDCEN